MINLSRFFSIFLLFYLVSPGLLSEDLGQILWGERKLSGPINFDYISSKFKQKSSTRISGDFSINDYPDGVGYTILRDTDNFKNRKNDELFKDFPSFNIGIIIDGENTFVENKEIIETKHKYWDITFSDGMAWTEDFNTYVAIPFALLQKHANCTHNGILIFAINKNINSSKAIMQISSETCAYFQFNYVAIFKSKFQKRDIFFPNQKEKPQIRDFDEIYTKYPFLKKKSFADSEVFNKDEVTAFGFYDGVDHFMGGCSTRSGNYPFCENITLPAYSLTKSISGTLGAAAYEKKYESVSNKMVSDLIRDCAGDKWDDVRFESLADMVTGNFKSDIHSVDEDSLSSLNFIFNLTESTEKVNFACNNYPKRTSPNKKFVYHSSDTYLLGLALNNLLTDKVENDYFNDLLIPIFNKKDFSEKIKYIRRTTDKEKVPYSGWGMYFERNDLILLNNLIRSDERKKYFSDSYIMEALQLTTDKGFKALQSSDIFYNNGIWSARFEKDIFGCKDDLYVPFMSGFGGITVVFLPNSMLYYYISDNYTFSWYPAVYAAHEIRPLC